MVNSEQQTIQVLNPASINLDLKPQSLLIEL